MSLTINIDNYEEIMFQLLEGDFDEQTSNALLQQIEKDELFKFEWEAWQKTRFSDPIENYTASSKELTEKIILIAETQNAGRKRIIYYWAAAASIILLIGTLFLLTADYTSRPKQELVITVSKSKTAVKNVNPPSQNQTTSIVISGHKKFRNSKKEKQFTDLPVDSNTLVPNENILAEIRKLIDSAPVKTNELVTETVKKPRFTVTVETSNISGSNQQNYVMAKREKVKMNKVFTNTKIFLRRKPDGEPDRLILIGDDNSFLCLNLNY